jgi:hypothetical protein
MNNKNKIFRVFYKKEDDEVFDVSCENQEILGKSFEFISEIAQQYAKDRNFRVAMIAETVKQVGI